MNKYRVVIKKTAVILLIIIAGVTFLKPVENYDYRLTRERSAYYEEIHDMSIDDLIRLNRNLKTDATLNFTDDSRKQLRSIKGSFAGGKIESEFDCLNALYGIRTLLGIFDRKNTLRFAGADEWELKEFLKVYKLNDDYTDSSNTPGKRFLYWQYYNGVEVAGAYVTAFVSHNGLTYLSSNLENINSGNISAVPIIIEDEARKIALNFCKPLISYVESGLYIYKVHVDGKKEYKFVYLVEIYLKGFDRASLYFDYPVEIEASSGAIINRYAFKTFF